MKNLFLVFAAVACFSSPAWAKSESWYWGFGLGWGSPSYPTAIQSAVDTAKAQGASHTPIALDLGFHWPVGSTTTLGTSINGVTDTYEQVGKVSIVQTGLFMTLFQTFGGEPMKGFFLRGDIGLGRVAAESNGVTAASDFGLGLIGGTGFMLAVSDETRLVFQATYGYRHVQGNDYGLFALTFGPMF